MERKHFLAAQIYGYSYAHYAEYLEKEDVRFTTLMPEEVDILEQAQRESWQPWQLADALGIEEDKVGIWQELYATSSSIVDAGSCVDAFRTGIRAILRGSGLEDGIIERLVIQICYQAADLGYLLDMEGKRLSEYAGTLRQADSVDSSWLIAQFGDIADQYE